MAKGFSCFLLFRGVGGCGKGCWLHSRWLSLVQMSHFLSANQNKYRNISVTKNILLFLKNVVITGWYQVCASKANCYNDVLFFNFRSLYHLTMLAVPHLIKTKGNIVNVSSVNGMRSVSTIAWKHL